MTDSPTIFDRFHALTRQLEGGFVSRERAHSYGDRGGETFEGITEATLQRLGISQKPSELTSEQRRGIYFQTYFAPIRELVRVDVGVAFLTYDFGVQSGPGTAVKGLQRVTGARGDDVDGRVGPNTLGRVRYHGVLPALLDLAAYRRAFVEAWIKADPSRAQIRNGMHNRVDNALRIAVELTMQECAFFRAHELWRPNGAA